MPGSNHFGEQDFKQSAVPGTDRTSGDRSEQFYIRSKELYFTQVPLNFPPTPGHGFIFIPQHCF